MASNVGVYSPNLAEARRQWGANVSGFQDAIEDSMKQNAKLLLRESIVEMDALIYATPPSTTYVRTKNLRRSSHHKPMGRFSHLVYNDAQYAGYVHDGTEDMPARPWLANAAARMENVMESNIRAAGTRALGGRL